MKRSPAKLIRCAAIALAWLTAFLQPARGFASAAPTNDLCAGAQIIPASGPFPYLTPVTADISGATTTNDPPASSCQPNVSRSIWYKFTPAASGQYVLSTSADTATTVNDTVLAIYTSSGGCTGPFNQIACDDDTDGGVRAALQVPLNANTAYYILVWAFKTTALPTNQTAIQLRVSKPVVPLNDLCSGAEVIPAFGPFPWLTAIIDTTKAGTTSDPPAPSCQSVLSRSVWFRFTPGSTDSYTISSCADQTGTTVFDTVMAIYTSSGGCGGAMTNVACNDINIRCNEEQASITATLNSGVTYYILLWEFDNQPPVPGKTLVQLRVSATRPRFLAAAWTSEQNFRIQFGGVATNAYTIQSCTSFTNWLNLGTASNLGNGLFEFTDTNATALPHRFYRVSSP
jgi:hypothetical protein